ncbi:hypothetical protein [Flavobacterium sp. UMI-01]|uniref:DMP19 family protein n=1 Tax=Flavobacterium sp. UMI-01 TaxID=1441053 RepID=UPI001C7CBE31|nr:hypothetical protein [Flavobacterium sp. UMI-01]GIZ07788.1 hypothetical protein FUMI01_05150 [Flavobacterium sp. UMI-01]
MEFGSILISENAANSENSQDIINSNISIINLMREEKIDDEFIHEDALMSYYLDYYVTQCAQGNFAQFVYNSGWNNELNELIEEGLQLLGAHHQLEFFQQQAKKVRLMSSVKLAKFLKGKLEGVNPVRDALNENVFYGVVPNTQDLEKENLVELNAAFLKNHPDTQILPVEAIFELLEDYLERDIKRN